MITYRTTTVVVDAIIHVDSDGNIIRIEHRGRRYDIVDPMNAGNVPAGKIHVCEDVVVSGPFWESQREGIREMSDADRVTKPLTQPIREDEAPTDSAQMPRYRSHKEVWALKIAAIAFDEDKARVEDRETDGSAIITPAEPGYAPFKVSAEYVRKHDPKAGGYFVVYRDGYQSWSPASEFEDGYTLIA